MTTGGCVVEALKSKKWNMCSAQHSARNAVSQHSPLNTWHEQVPVKDAFLLKQI